MPEDLSVTWNDLIGHLKPKVSSLDSILISEVTYQHQLFWWSQEYRGCCSCRAHRPPPQAGRTGCCRLHRHSPPTLATFRWNKMSGFHFSHLTICTSCHNHIEDFSNHIEILHQSSWYHRDYCMWADIVGPLHQCCLYKVKYVHGLSKL